MKVINEKKTKKSGKNGSDHVEDNGSRTEFYHTAV